jgi:hypothetical protein
MQLCIILLLQLTIYDAKFSLDVYTGCPLDQEINLPFPRGPYTTSNWQPDSNLRIGLSLHAVPDKLNTACLKISG